MRFGQSDLPDENDDVFLTKIDLATGDSIWTKNYGGIEDEGVEALIATKDKGFVLVGKSNSFSNGDLDAYFVKTDSIGQVYTNIVQGQLAIDEDNVCIPNPSNRPLKGWLIKAESESNRTFYATTDAHGFYEIQLDTGFYYLSAISPNPYWVTCMDSLVLSFEMQYDTIEQDFLAQAVTYCPLLGVDISTFGLLRCDTNSYTVTYCNEGTIEAENAWIEVGFDGYVQLIDTTAIPFPYQRLSDSLWSFHIGNVPINHCADFTLTTLLQCEEDTPLLGQTHCLKAHIFPDSICMPLDTLWDGSSIEVEGKCEGDAVQFRIINEGQDMQMPLEYEIIVDEVILYNLENEEFIHQGEFQLAAGEDTTITLVATGQTFRLEAQQAIGHPGNDMPSTVIEGCGGFNLGFVNLFPENDANYFVSIDCQENVGNFGPNRNPSGDFSQLRAFPKGYRENHYVTANQDIEYHIRFQIPYPDTIFNTIIRDTLSPFLRPETFRAGASSHPYQWKIDGNGAITFELLETLLPSDSLVFIKFRVAQQPDLLLGTQIKHQASIYLNFDAPIVTERVFHTVGKGFIEIENVQDSMVLIENIPLPALRVYPNPFVESAVFELADDVGKVFTLSIFDVGGRKVQTIQSDESPLVFHRKNLPAGTYFFELRSEKRGLYTGKIVLH